MNKGYRIVFETYDLNHPESTLEKSTLFRGDITAPTNCLDFSLEQKEILQISLDKKQEKIGDIYGHSL